MKLDIFYQGITFSVIMCQNTSFGYKELTALRSASQVSLASPSRISVLSLKRTGFCIPAYPVFPIDLLKTKT
jgi:hypothetical protein